MERPPAKPKRGALLAPPLVVATLKLAEGFQRQRELGLVKHFAELADAHDMVRPRVTQIMKLLKLPAPVLAYVKGLGSGLRALDVTERKLVRLLRLSPAQQLVEARRTLPGFAEFLESRGMATGTSPRVASHGDAR